MRPRPFLAPAVSAVAVALGTLSPTAAPPPSPPGQLCTITHPNCCAKATSLGGPCNR